MEIRSVRHSWPEKAGFAIRRPTGTADYVLLHFNTPVLLTFGGRTVNTQPGAFIIFSPGYSHVFTTDKPLLHDWMHLLGDVPAALRKYGLQTDTLYMPDCSRQITSIVAQLEEEFFAKREFWPQFSELKLLELFITVSRSLKNISALPLPVETANLLRDLRARLLMNPELPWNNALMAKHVNTSISHLYPLYRRMFSISPNRDLILIRVEKAKNMLANGQSVAYTAEATGYASTYHFIRQFRQITGITPGKYSDKPENGH